jgi:cardiolipin synthase
LAYSNNRKRSGGGSGGFGKIFIILIIIVVGFFYFSNGGSINKIIAAVKSGNGSITSAANSAASATPTTIPSAGSVSPTSSQYTLIQYPDAGFSDVYARTNAAKTSITMEMYELNDQTEETALVNAHKRGVDVKVILDSAFHGKAANEKAYSFLTGAGVSVHWAPAGYIYHIKAITFDHTVTSISTANLTAQYYATGRDADIIDTNPVQVAAVEKTFNNDWTGPIPSADTVQSSGLLWSPGAEAGMVSQISSAKKSIDYTSEELTDPAVYNALAADAKRGIKCEIVMTYSSSWTTGFKIATAAGCVVHTYKNSTNGLYIHEKIVLTDAGTSSGQLLISSQNGSSYSLNRNRELGVILNAQNAPKVLISVQSTFNKDFAGGTKWVG